MSAKLNFHRPLVCSTIRNIQYYTPEVRGSSVWQISKKYFAGVIYGQNSLMCQLCSLKRFTHKFNSLRHIVRGVLKLQTIFSSFDPRNTYLCMHDIITRSFLYSFVLFFKFRLRLMHLMPKVLCWKLLQTRFQPNFGKIVAKQRISVVS